MTGIRRPWQRCERIPAVRAPTGWIATRIDLDEDEAPYAADPDHLRRFIQTQLMPWHARRRTELANRPLIRERAFGESLDADKLEVLARYEMHLDRKFERMLTMLMRLTLLNAASSHRGR